MWERDQVRMPQNTCGGQRVISMSVLLFSRVCQGPFVFLHCTQRTMLAHKFLGLLPSPPSFCPGSCRVTDVCCCAWLYVGSWASTSDPQPCMASGLFLTSPLQPSTFHELICRCNILGPLIASVIGVFITVSRTWSHLPYFKSL